MRPAIAGYRQDTDSMLTTRHMLALLIVCLLAACATARQQSQWDDIDYSRIAQQNQARENDANYRPPVPTVIGCSDDDLYNCK
jgi:hypothetical protein